LIHRYHFKRVQFKDNHDTYFCLKHSISEDLWDYVREKLFENISRKELLYWKNVIEISMNKDIVKEKI